MNASDIRKYDVLQWVGEKLDEYSDRPDYEGEVVVFQVYQDDVAEIGWLDDIGFVRGATVRTEDLQRIPGRIYDPEVYFAEAAKDHEARSEPTA